MTVPDCIAVHPIALSLLCRRATRLATAVLGAVAIAVARADAVLASVDPEQTVSDPERTRVITIAIVVMVVAGVLVLAVTVWFWRSTRPEPSALAPLEVMGERSFVRADHDEQQRRLDKVRPAGEETEADVEPVEAGLPAGAGEPAGGPEPDAPAEPVEPATATEPTEPGTESEPPAEAEATAGEPPADADGSAEEHHDHTPEGDQRPTTDGDEAPQPAIDPLLGRFQ